MAREHQFFPVYLSLELVRGNLTKPDNFYSYLLQ